LGDGRACVLPCADAGSHVSCPAEISTLLAGDGGRVQSVREFTGCVSDDNVFEVHWEYTASDGARKGGEAAFRCYCEGGRVTQKIKPGMTHVYVLDPETGTPLQGPAPQSTPWRGGRRATFDNLAAVCSRVQRWCSSD
jgi:hypothetical protein